MSATRMKFASTAVLAAASLALVSTTALAQPADAPEMSIRNLGAVNSQADEYGPYLLPDATRLFYTSSVSGTANLYISRFADGTWSAGEAVNLPGINTDRDDGALSGPFPALAQLFPLDEPTMVSMNIPAVALLTSGKRREGKGDADIYLARMLPVGQLADEVIPLEAINTEKWESQPTIAPDGRFIVFASNRRGGRGGTDLYISYRHDDGSYGAPVNLGAIVNSSGDEMSPHIAPDSRTLFFSSDGHGGLGGMDIFRTRLSGDEQWSRPENLGARINTSDNETFFYGAGYTACYFASDRRGGRGGLDLYMGTPNIFAAGYEQVTWSSRDTISGKGIGGTLRIIEQQTGRVVSQTTVDPERGTLLPIVAGFDYRVEFSPTGYPDTVLTVADVLPDQTRVRSINFGRPLPPEPEVPVAVKRDFRLEGINVPLFVSGYYRLNTPQLLEELRTLQSTGVLRGRTYVANVTTDTRSAMDYRAMAARVDVKLREFVQNAVREDFPGFAEFRQEDEILQIDVSGYADPRPIVGVYVEKPVTFRDARGIEHTVNPGDSLDNFALAGLRAAYAVEHLDRLMREEAARIDRTYLDLLDRGLVRWHAISGDVDDISGGDNLAEKRRIRLEYRRLKGSGK